MSGSFGRAGGCCVAVGKGKVVVEPECDKRGSGGKGKRAVWRVENSGRERPRCVVVAGWLMPVV